MRKPFNTELDLFIDAHSLLAESIDISENGFRFKIKEPIRCRVRLEFGVEMIEREVQLVWAREEEGEMLYGFQFTSGSKGWKY